jgi:LssY C-terminus
MGTTKQTMLATINMIRVAAVLAVAAWAQGAQQPAPNSRTVQETTAAGTQAAPATATTEASKASATKGSYTIEVSASKEWMDTNIDLRAGEKLQITAEGTITYSDAKKNHFGPAGIQRSFADVIHQYAVPNGAHGKLIGRLGSDDATDAFEVGASATYKAPVAGRLFLGINQDMRDAAGASGSFQVKIEVLNEGLGTPDATVVGGPAETPLPAITPKLLDSIPRRVADQNHSPGDMVNILIVGTEEEMVKAFTTADWVQVDKSVRSTVLAGLLDTFEKKDYLTMPMSTLYLFDRPQDYGFAHGEPVRVMMSRNHLRVWKAPYQVNGRPLWCVAATHDIGFERDQRNDGVTHKIDPAIDGEREYVNRTLSGTGLVSARGHVVPTHPVTEAKTATGGGFHSDGRILVLVLKSGGVDNQDDQ